MSARDYLPDVRSMLAEGLSSREIARRLGISGSTVTRLVRLLPTVQRTCAECGEPYTGQTNSIVCSDACRQSRDNRRRVESSRAVRAAARSKGYVEGRDCLTCGVAVRRRGQHYCPRHRATVGRPVSETDAECAGPTVEEWLAERRPSWARDPSPRPDAWAGYSADAASIGW